MAKHRDMLQFQADHHPFEGTDRFETLEQYCLHLMHMRAYEEVRSLASGKVALDLGCNDGWGPQVIAQTARRVVGVDVSERLLEQARLATASSHVEFRLVDGERLPFSDGEFDVVASCQVIEHVVDYGPYLGEIVRVLSPGGVAVFTTANARIRLDPGMKPWFPFHVREFSGAELEELLERWFSAVEVKGLFATAELYNVEYQRVQRSRERARRRARALFPPYVEIRAKAIDSVKAVLPDFVVAELQRLVRRMTPASDAIPDQTAATGTVGDPAWLKRYSTGDFHYAAENMDESLDLLAVCNKRELY